MPIFHAGRKGLDLSPEPFASFHLCGTIMPTYEEADHPAVLAANLGRRRSNTRLHSLGKSLHRHRRTRSHIPRCDAPVRDGTALARHTYRQLGWLVRLSLQRRCHLRLLAYASERDWDSGWVRYFVYADGG